MLATRSLAPVGLAVLLSLGGALFVPLRITGSELSGRVVDPNTGNPVSNAHIVAVWELENGTFGGLVPGGRIQVLETRSAADGRYRFPKWHKVLSCATCTVSDRAAPQLFVFKPKYEPATFINDIWPSDATAPIPFHSGGTYRSEWNGKDLALVSATSPDSRAYGLRVLRFKNALIQSAGRKGWPDMATDINPITDPL